MVHALREARQPALRLFLLRIGVSVDFAFPSRPFRAVLPGEPAGYPRDLPRGERVDHRAREVGRVEPERAHRPQEPRRRGFLSRRRSSHRLIDGRVIEPGADSRVRRGPPIEHPPDDRRQQVIQHGERPDENHAVDDDAPRGERDQAFRPARVSRDAMQRERGEDALDVHRGAVHRIYTERRARRHRGYEVGSKGRGTVAWEATRCVRGYDSALRQHRLNYRPSFMSMTPYT